MINIFHIRLKDSDSCKTFLQQQFIYHFIINIGVSKDTSVLVTFGYIEFKSDCMILKQLCCKRTRLWPEGLYRFYFRSVD